MPDEAHGRPAHRPRNERRIGAMRRALAAALEMDHHAPEHLRELYDGREFPPRPWTLDQHVGWCLRLIRGDRAGIPEDFIDWHELSAATAQPIPKMAAYEAAAEVFNAILAAAQAHGDRLDELPTNGSALQRALARESRRKSTQAPDPNQNSSV